LSSKTGSYDNAVAGLDFKANVAGKFQFYGQVLMDEFNLTKQKKAMAGGVINTVSSWVPNILMPSTSATSTCSSETNRVRPFTYSHRDSVANYTHYNQALAHPLGANFQEVIRHSQVPASSKMVYNGKSFLHMQGKDTLNGLTTSGS
jgi:hypothetical protein